MECQRSKIGRHTKSAKQAFDIPTARFTTVHLDIVGPLTNPIQTNSLFSSSPRYLLTMIDRATDWIEATPISSITAEDVAFAFITQWVSRFGVPLYVVTDRGTQFESELFSIISKSIGFHRLRTCSYHPQTNGKIERAHRTLKAILRAKHSNWLEDLPVALLAMHVAPDDNGLSPFEKVTGEKPMIPHVLTNNQSPVTESLRTHISEMIQNSARQQNKTFYIPKELFTTDYVWVRVDRVRRPLEAPYQGPYKVLDRKEKFFKIELPTGATQVSIDRLKPVFKKTVTTPKPIPSISEPSSDPLNLSDSSVKTRSGRKVRFSRLNDYFYF